MKQNLVSIDKSELSTYVTQQICHIMPLPGGHREDFRLIEAHLDEALIRTQRCIDEVKVWIPGQFDIKHSSQYCIFLYYLANTIWQREGCNDVCTHLFILNKALNAIDLFYEVEMPEVFFIGHSVGIVLAKATYGNFFVIYQNSTVGKNHGEAPCLEEGVIMYPNTAIIGPCYVRKGSVIAQGVSIINRDTHSFQIAFQAERGNIEFRRMMRLIQVDFFRNFSD